MTQLTHQRLVCFVALLAVTTSSAEKEQSRWSRQISSYTSDISDWVPLAAPVEKEPPPIKRQAVAEPRILSEPFSEFPRPTGFSQDAFPSRTFYQAPGNRQLYLQSVPSVPSAPQNFLSDQGFGQSIRFGLTQPNFPLSQGFIAPQLTFENVPQIKQRPQTISTNPVKFESFQKPNAPVTPQTKPFVNQAPKTKPDIPKFVDGYRLENVSNDFVINSKKPQSLQKLKYDNIDKVPKLETPAPSRPKAEREEVQLLYVPMETLNRGQFNMRSPISTAHLINTDIFSQGLPKPAPLKQTFTSDFQRPIAKPIDNFGFGQEYFANFNNQLKDFDQVPKFSMISTPFPTLPPTTPKPKRLKPHQPPLAVFLAQEVKKGNQVKVSDVLTSLKNANTIAVLDSVNPLNAPKVFIGPSSLASPENYVKFELPYLSNIENSDKKLRQLPFFVAPLSYNTPDGFAKIPFPSPHVGSVVINSQIKEATTLSTPTADIIPNSYTASPPSYKQDRKYVTQKPNFSYYSTAVPKMNPPNVQSSYYSFEPQTVTSISPKESEPSVAPAPSKTGSYFLSNIGTQYNPAQYVNFPSQNRFSAPEPVNQNNVYKQTEATTSIKTTPMTTTSKPSTYPNQLLETHNPYSINQAFHFSTPLDYHSYFDEYKEGYATPGQDLSPPPSPPSSPSPAPVSVNPSPSPSPKVEQTTTEKEKYKQHSSPNYVQNYTPEIHYESEIQNSRYPVYEKNSYTTKAEATPQYSQPIISPVKADDNVYPASNLNPTENNGAIETQFPQLHNNLTEKINEIQTTSYDTDIHSTRSTYAYNQYENTYNFNENQQTIPASTTTTTTSTTTTSTTTTRPTTRRTPLRSRGRPRYTTPRTDSNEYITKSVYTRRPLRERRPLSTKPTYEPNKITTEKPFRQSGESNESTTKSFRTKTRGRIHYRPSENDDIYDKRNKARDNKEDDLAYQRDVLHQNYPVTLMERKSTVDIEALTEPSPKISSTKNINPPTESYDTENAYTNEKLYISQQIKSTESKDDTSLHTSQPEVENLDTYVPKLSSNRNDEYNIFQSRSSLTPFEGVSSYDETSPENEQVSYPKQTTFVDKSNKPETSTEPISPSTEESLPVYSNDDEYSSVKQEKITTPDEITKINEELSQEHEEEENVVHTTPSYNRVRVRPGVIRQYHQASSTESSRNKNDRRRPVQAITYRPAYVRRTTMRIEEIEADLKTKQVHARPEVQDYKHPVYRPETSTEIPLTTASTRDATKRGPIRRRRPVYSSASTEATSTKKNNYEIKNRFRGRRPTTEKPTEKSELQADVSTSTLKSTLHSRYSNRPRLSERYNKKPETEEVEDQDSNYSINQPNFAAPESEQWSPKISVDSFRPYNPNDIIDDKKIATTERRSDRGNEGDLDIITARNEFEDILISVTPATNSRVNKKIPDIPPTLEALVEQSKITKSDTNDAMSTFESMLEQVMKSLEEQDENEYTTNVMKHKGGEIGEIPPEEIITSEDSYSMKSSTRPESTTVETALDESTLHSEEEKERNGRRRGFWKKVKVRPVTTETIETAESQFYHRTVNRFGEEVKQSKTVHNKSDKYETSKLPVTTYKPNFDFFKDIFQNESEIIDVLPIIDITKIQKDEKENKSISLTTTEVLEKNTSNLNQKIQTEKSDLNPGDVDLGTGSPDPTIADMFTTPTEPTTSKTSSVSRSDKFSIMDYLFGVTASDSDDKSESKRNESEVEVVDSTTSVTNEVTANQKNNIITTESTYIPDEITTSKTEEEENTATITTEFSEVKNVNNTENLKEKVFETTENSAIKTETFTESNFMDPSNVVSTSMSTQVSHETEICFRGKCIKTNKDIL